MGSRSSPATERNSGRKSVTQKDAKQRSAEGRALADQSSARTPEGHGAKIATARLGDRAVLGGPAALEIPTEFPWKTVYLWLALLAAVLVISFMVMKLARDMSAESN